MSSESPDAVAASDADTTLAVVTHLLGLFTWVVGPLVVLLVADDEFVDENARNAVNWQLFLGLYSLVGIVLSVVLVGVFVLMIVGLLDVVFCVVAAVKAADDEAWSYPLTLDAI